MPRPNGRPSTAPGLQPPLGGRGERVHPPPDHVAHRCPARPRAARGRPPPPPARARARARRTGCRPCAGARRRPSRRCRRRAAAAGARPRSASPRRAMVSAPGSGRRGVGGAVGEHDEHARRARARRRRGGAAPATTRRPSGGPPARRRAGAAAVRSSERATASKSRGRSSSSAAPPALAGQPGEVRGVLGRAGSASACSASRSAWRMGRHGANGAPPRRRGPTAPRRRGARASSATAVARRVLPIPASPVSADDAAARRARQPRGSASRRASSAVPSDERLVVVRGQGAREAGRAPPSGRAPRRPWPGAPARVLGQEREDQGVERGGHAGHPARRRHGRGAQVLLDHRVRVAREGRPAADELVQGRAERVEVAVGPDAAAVRLLGRHVERRAGQRAAPRPGASSPASAMPKSPSAAPPSPVEPDVVRLDVAVDDAVVVRVRQRAGQLGPDAHDVRHGQPVAGRRGEPRGERAARHVARDDEQRAVVLDDVVHGHDLRVVAQPRHQPRLAPDALARLRARALDARERDRAVEREVVGEPDLLHAAPAEQALHEVAAHDGRRRPGAPAAPGAAGSVQVGQGEPSGGLGRPQLGHDVCGGPITARNGPTSRFRPASAAGRRAPARRVLPSRPGGRAPARRACRPGGPACPGEAGLPSRPGGRAAARRAACARAGSRAVPRRG